MSWSSEPWMMVVGVVMRGRSGVVFGVSQRLGLSSDAVGVVAAVMHQTTELADPAEVSRVARRGRDGLVLYEEFDGFVAIASGLSFEPSGEQIDTLDEVGARCAVDEGEREHSVRVVESEVLSDHATH